MIWEGVTTSDINIDQSMSGHLKMDFYEIYSLEIETYVVCCVRFLAESKNSLN